MSKLSILGLGVAFLAIFGLLGCSDNGNPLAPYQPEINNATDNFQFQATAMRNVNFSMDYIWRNTGDTATVNQSASAGLTGTATLEILDSSGTQVYSHDLKANGTFGTSQRLAAEPGPWILRVRLVKVSGTLNFRVQKST